MKTNNKPYNENKKEVLSRLFDTFIKEGHLEGGNAIFYDILKEYGNINPPKEDVFEACRKASIILLRKDALLPKRIQKPYLYARNSCFMVKNKAKTLILEDLFAKIDAEGKHLKQFLI